MLGYEFLVLSIILAAKQKLFQTSLVIFEFHHLQSSNHPLAYPANSFSNVKWMFFSLSQSLPLSLLSFSLQEKRISSLDAANSRLMSALTQVKERYSMQNLHNGLSPTNPTKLSITENGEFKNSNCWFSRTVQDGVMVTLSPCTQTNYLWLYKECLDINVNSLYLVLVVYRDDTERHVFWRREQGDQLLSWNSELLFYKWHSHMQTNAVLNRFEGFSN